MRTRFLLVAAAAAVALVAAVPSHAQAQAPVSTPNELGVTYDHVSFTVADPQPLVDFFTKLGGAPQTAKGDAAMRVDFPLMYVVVRKGASEGGMVGSAVNHIGFHVPNTDAAMEKWRAAGLTVDKGTTPGQAWLNGPDGVRIEILQNDKMTVPIQGHHVHFFTMTPLDMQAWYVKTFGAVAGKRAGFDAADVSLINLTFTQAKEAPAPIKGRVLDRVAFSVSSLEQFCKRLQELGVKFDMPYTARKNGTAMAVIEDPFGATIELDEHASRGTGN